MPSEGDGEGRPTPEVPGTTAAKLPRERLRPKECSEEAMMRIEDNVTSSLRGWIGCVGAGVMALGCSDASIPPVDNDRSAVEVESVGRSLMADPAGQVSPPA